MPVTKTCPECGTAFRVKPSHYERTVYCSKECMGRGYRKRLLGEANPNHRAAGWHICERCGEQFQSYNKARKYCSPECYNLTRPAKSKPAPVVRVAKPHYAPRVPLLKSYDCRVCGRRFQAFNLRVLCDECAAKRLYLDRECVVCHCTFHWFNAKATCSPECEKKLRAVAQKGPKSHRWQGGKTVAKKLVRNSQEYAEWRGQVFRRDDYTCQMCGQHGKKLAAHHIKPFETHPGLRLALSNGITLCWPCHRQIRGKEAEYEERFVAGVEGR